jgi:hypothetical protein
MHPMDTRTHSYNVMVMGKPDREIHRYVPTLRAARILMQAARVKDPSRDYYVKRVNV